MSKHPTQEAREEPRNGVNFTQVNTFAVVVFGHSVTLVILSEPAVDAELKNTACYGPCIR